MKKATYSSKLLLLLLLAFTQVSPAESDDLAVINNFILNSREFTVTKGNLGSLDVNQCSFIKCAGGINPATPYIYVGLPPSPNQSRLVKPSLQTLYFESASTVSAPSNAAFYLDGVNELVVIVGTTPPKSAYLGLTGYIATHVVKKIRLPVLAATGDTVNHLTFKTGGQGTFGQPFVAVMGANQALVEKFRESLEDIGQDDLLNVLPIPAADPALGLITNVTNKDADEHTIILRASYPESSSALENYVANLNTNLKAYRLTYKSPVNLKYYGPATARPTLKSPPGPTQASFQTELNDQVKHFLASLGSGASKYRQCVMKQISLVSKECITTGKSCLANNSDAFYGDMGFAQFEDRNGAPYKYFVFGVNGPNTLKANYDSLTVQTLLNPIAIALGGGSTAKSDLAGTLNNSTSNPNIFRYEFARNCQGRAHCFSVPLPNNTSSIPFGVPMGGVGQIITRTYIQAASKTAPDPSVILPWVAVTNNPLAASCR